MKKFEERPIPLIYRNENKGISFITQSTKSTLKL